MEAMEVPIGNIGERGCRRRRTGGWVWTAIAILGITWIDAIHAPRKLLLLIAIPILFAALGFLQAREQTCVFHAATGTRENDDGVVKLDVRARDDVARRARRVWSMSIVAALVITAAVYFITSLLQPT
jgi:hypothetical protein